MRVFMGDVSSIALSPFNLSRFRVRLSPRRATELCAIVLASTLLLRRCVMQNVAHEQRPGMAIVRRAIMIVLRKRYHIVATSMRGYYVIDFCPWLSRGIQAHSQPCES